MAAGDENFNEQGIGPSPEPGNRITVLVGAVCGLSLAGVAGVVTVFLIRPDKDNTQVIAVILGLIVPIVSALLAAALQQLHAAVNSRLTQLVKLTAKSSRAEGQLAGQGDPMAAIRVLEEAADRAATKIRDAAESARVKIAVAVASTAAVTAPVLEPVNVHITNDQPIPVIDEAAKHRS